MSEKISLNELFLEPLALAFGDSTITRDCPRYSDWDFLTAGLNRCISPVASGREFLQMDFESAERSWKLSSYFEALKSTRRGEFVCEVAELLAGLVGKAHSARQWPSDLPELKEFEIFAGDGHFHKSAAHDPKALNGKAIPVGHFFARNMRTAVLHHIDTAAPGRDKIREHDMGMLKRQESAVLRLNVKKGRKVLYVWDPAGIDFQQWFKWKYSSGIYFLTRAKEGMSTDKSGDYEWDKDDPRNNGVVADELIMTSTNIAVRRVEYIDPPTGTTYAFVTNLPASIPPGVIAWLYQRRWDIEKTFDETRNRLGEGKAWATSVSAKRIQGAFISIAYNLLLLLEERMRQDEDMPPEPEEDKRREGRREIKIQKAKDCGRKISYTLQRPPWRTQIGCKFIRWVRRHAAAGTSYRQATAILRRIYEEFS